MTVGERASQAWSSRTAFLLAAIGGAVGLGNLWRFPYVAGEYGGGAFVLVYLAFVFLLGAPLMAAEMLLGRRGHRSAVNSMAALVRDENASGIWKTIGWISVLVPFLGLSYYAVVAAWAIDYLAVAGGNGFSGFDGETSGRVFGERIDRPVYQSALHLLFIVMTVVVIARGVNKGIERATKVLMPLLFVVIVVLVFYGAIAGDFAAAARFLFNPDFAALTGEAILVALGQALFSLAVGVGLMITYAAYMPKEFPIRTSCTVICIGDTLAALLAGFAIFPIVFASGLDPAEGPGLIFVTLPVAFGNMPAGHLIGTLFFLLLLFAAYTSSIGMLEPIVSWLEDRRPGTRVSMAVVSGLIIWVLGLRLGVLVQFLGRLLSARFPRYRTQYLQPHGLRRGERIHPGQCLDDRAVCGLGAEQQDGGRGIRAGYRWLASLLAVCESLPDAAGANNCTHRPARLDQLSEIAAHLVGICGLIFAESRQISRSIEAPTRGRSEHVERDEVGTD